MFWFRGPPSGLEVGNRLSEECVSQTFDPLRNAETEGLCTKQMENPHSTGTTNRAVETKFVIAIANSQLPSGAAVSQFVCLRGSNGRR
jgi:hypothetical protein